LDAYGQYQPSTHVNITAGAGRVKVTSLGRKSLKRTRPIAPLGGTPSRVEGSRLDRLSTGVYPICWAMARLTAFPEWLSSSRDRRMTGGSQGPPTGEERSARNGTPGRAQRRMMRWVRAAVRS